MQGSPKERVASFIKPLLQPRGILLIYVAMALLASVFAYFSDAKIYAGQPFTKYNNYEIFEASFGHLLAGENLYIHYPEEHYDLFKYSPTFAMAMGLLSWMPTLLGLCLWNLVNALALYGGIFFLPRLGIDSKIRISLLTTIELFTCLQNAQSNALLAGSICLSFRLLWDGRILVGYIPIWIAVFTKLFGIFGLLLWFLFKRKLLHLIAATVIGVVFLLVPALVAGFDGLIVHYQQWYELLAADHDRSHGLSVMGWLITWFSWAPGKLAIVAVGGVLLVLPLLQVKKWHRGLFRILYLANILIWVVIFNHMAESPTYILAVTGVGIWFFALKRNWIDMILVVFFIVFTMLGSTDVFPKSWQYDLIDAYVMKAVPVIFIWIRMQFELWGFRSTLYAQPE